MLSHKNIWAAIDRLAETNDLSPSALAKKAGLSATLFNPSKRKSTKRERWPSSESIAAILKATGTSLNEFVGLIDATTAKQSVPLLALTNGSMAEAFDPATGKPIGRKWDTLSVLTANEADAFALEVCGHQHEPLYTDGCRVVLSPSSDIRRGDKVGACTKDGEIHLRILGREGGQKVELLSLSPDVAPLTLAKKDILWLHRIIWASQ